jgi:hypothetical protein
MAIIFIFAETIKNAEGSGEEGPREDAFCLRRIPGLLQKPIRDAFGQVAQPFNGNNMLFE